MDSLTRTKIAEKAARIINPEGAVPIQGYFSVGSYTYTVHEVAQAIADMVAAEVDPLIESLMDRIDQLEDQALDDAMYQLEASKMSMDTYY